MLGLRKPVTKSGRSSKRTLAQRASELWPDDAGSAGPVPWDAVSLMRRAGMEPDPMQFRVVTTPGHQLVLAHRQRGKALHIDTPLPTPDGWTTMQDVEPGDWVCNELGQACRVTWVSPIEQREVWEVQFSDGAALMADAEHLWTTLDANARYALTHQAGDVPKDWPFWESKGRKQRRQGTLGQPQCMFAGCSAPRRALEWCGGHYQQLKAGKTLRPLLGPSRAGARTLTTAAMQASLGRTYREEDRNHSIPATAPLLGAVQSLLIDPYTLGVWLGDGNSADAYVTQDEADSEIFEHIRLAGHPVERRKYSRWLIRGLFAPLRLGGLLGNKHIPRGYLRAPVAARIALLQGLMDTDGSAMEEGTSRCELTTTSKRLAHDVYELCVSLGLIVRMSESDATLQGRVVGRRWRLAFSPWFQVFRLARKAQRLVFDGPRKTLRKLRYVVDIIPKGIASVKCIAVDTPSRLYLAGRAMIPTHNSQIAASLAFEDALKYPGCLDLVVSRSLRQSGELFRKIKEFYNLTTPLPLVKDTEHELELSNGSRIISLPGNPDTLVGYSSVHRLILDEAARIPDPTYYALRPMLARSGGTILAISTPFGRRGWFYEAWEGQEAEQNLDVDTVERLLADLDFPIEEYSEGVEGLAPVIPDGQVYQWTKTFAPVTYCPRLSKAYIANERLNVPALWFDQEWLCKFVELGAVVFRYEDLLGMLSPTVTPLYGDDGAVLDDGQVLYDDLAPLPLNGATH